MLSLLNELRGFEQQPLTRLIYYCFPSWAGQMPWAEIMTCCTCALFLKEPPQDTVRVENDLPADPSAVRRASSLGASHFMLRRLNFNNNYNL